ncbi:MAG: AI-2E family transporter [Betaproteobacteria bacterium]|nr:AI-2E family transporter [Betaproteobacteria bacterium]
MPQDKTFVFLVILITAAFIWILRPFYGAIFWATMLAILFGPMFRRLTLGGRARRTPAALLTTFVIVVLVILPAAILTGMLVQEGLGVYQRVQSGELNFARYLQQIIGVLPAWATGWLEESGLTDFATMQERLSAGLMKGVQFFATQAFTVGTNTLEFIVAFFIMLYLLFFLLRDGDRLAQRIRSAVPLEHTLQQNLATKFAAVVRATIKGSLVVAVVQGALGGLIFWILGINAPVFWGVVMAFLSLLPAVGTALVWVPVAIYFLVTASLVKGLVLVAFGVFVIGMVDNVLRPILVGKDTKMPDYIVLISTLGGMAMFGINGFVIGPLIAAMFIAVWDTVAQANAARHTEL